MVRIVENNRDILKKLKEKRVSEIETIDIQLPP